MIRAIVVTLPTLPRVRIEAGEPDCRVCRLEHDDGRHLPASECGRPPCSKPWEHHVYRPLPWWRRLRRARGWW